MASTSGEAVVAGSVAPRCDAFLRRCRIAITAEINTPAAPAPISAQPHPGRSLDSEDFDALLAAAAAPTAAVPGAWLVEVGVVSEGVVAVSVLTTVFVWVGAVTVVV